jgi:PPP family 3-phenylpropionic acid transporter
MPFLLSLFYYFYFSIIGVYIIFMPKVLDMVGYSASEIGIIFAASPLVRFVVPFLFTRGFKLDLKTFNAALVIMVVSSIAFYFYLEEFYKLLIANIGLGFGLSLILPYIEVIALETIGKQNYGKIRLFGSLGFIVVALVLVEFLSSVGVALKFLLVLSIVTSIISFMVAKKSSVATQKIKDSKNDVKILKDWQLWLGLMLMQVSFGSFYNFFTIYETDFGISLDMTVYLWSFGVVVEIIMLFFQGALLKGNLLLILQLTALSAVLRWLLLFLFPQNLVVLFFAQSLHALSFALFYSAAISYLHQLYLHKTLAQQFFSGITFGLGGFIGALISGYIYEYLPSYLFLSSSVIALLACGYLYRWGIISIKVQSLE